VTITLFTLRRVCLLAGHRRQAKCQATRREAVQYGAAMALVLRCASSFSSLLDCRRPRNTKSSKHTLHMCSGHIVHFLRAFVLLSPLPVPGPCSLGKQPCCQVRWRRACGGPQPALAALCCTHGERAPAVLARARAWHCHRLS
jgi:hypothetical protein